MNKLKRMLGMYANVDNILKKEYVDIDRFVIEVMNQRVAHMDDKSIYFQGINVKDVDVVRRADGKEFYFPANILITHTDVLEIVSAFDIKNYHGRAKTLYKMPLVIYNEINNHYNKWLKGKQINIKELGVINV